MTYNIEIRIEVDDIELPTGVTTLDQIEATIEDRVGSALEPLVSGMTVHTVILKQSEQDWDALLIECSGE